ncbi:MAG: biopolymer transport protein ExbD [Bacteroidetes bacterium ADurb.Bin397]|jgi:biopolymer transport protein ExbD|nr:biopolymer transporter ExbD [Bacteroidota bacterium]OQA12777.1 MAG: biopolymer transport protein ExbD [Bacteroidetes bacterium ADurb.Bin397]
MAIRSRNKVNAKFEMSSMTDLVFLLLIFFMLITTLIVPNVNTLKLVLPNSNTAKPTENLTVSVAINENLEYFMDGQPVVFDQLEGNLSNFVAGKTDPVVVLHTANSVPVENVVKVMDIVNRLKVKMVLATNPEK